MNRRNTLRKWLATFALAVALPGCAGYFDPGDPYVSGMRWFNRQQYDWARKDWEPLARAGDCDAQYRMGTLYFLGAGVPQNYELARQWWVKAANQGQPIAQALLATLAAHDVIEITTIHHVARFDCTSGCGFEKNLFEAYQWMRLSEKCAVQEEARRTAAAVAQKYEQSLTDQQIAEAKRLVQAWTQVSGQCGPRRQVSR